MKWLLPLLVLMAPLVFGIAYGAVFALTDLLVELLI